MKKRSDPLSCPCASGQTYEQCCQRWHDGTQLLQAPDAVSLMRSRYSAFVFDLRPYLLATWHPRTRPQTIDPPDPELKWIGLQICSHQQQDDTHATVEFIAKYRIRGKAHRLHELSRFERISGQWYYADGEFQE